MCKFEVKKRAFPRGNPGFLGEFFPENSGKIWENLENPEFSGKIWKNPGFSGISSTQNLGKIKKFSLNLNFLRKCRYVNSPIFGRFSRFLQIEITILVICKFTRFNSYF